MLKEKMCGMLTGHRKSKRSTINDKGQTFRYVKSCRCGKHEIKSVPLHDNDLLSNINISEWNFPIDETTQKNAL